jgi:hypothetical protein
VWPRFDTLTACVTQFAEVPTIISVRGTLVPLIPCSAGRIFDVP